MIETSEALADLYRMYDEGGTLLYIGLSAHAGQRARQHQRDKAWWDDVRTIAIEKVPADLIAEAEAIAINAERPLHNRVAGKGGGTTNRGGMIPVQIRLPPATIAALDALAERKGMTRAELLRLAADEMIKREGKK